MSYFDQPALAHRKPLRPSAHLHELQRPHHYHANSAPILSVPEVVGDVHAWPSETEWPGHHDAHTITVCQSLQTPTLSASNESSKSLAGDYFQLEKTVAADVTPQQIAPVTSVCEMKAQAMGSERQHHSSPVSVPASSPCPRLREDSIGERVPGTTSVLHQQTGRLTPTIPQEENPSLGVLISPTPTECSGTRPQDQPQLQSFLQFAYSSTALEGRALALPGKRRGLLRAQSSNAAPLAMKTYLDNSADKENVTPDTVEAPRCSKRLSSGDLEPPTPRTALANALSRTHILAQPVVNRTPPVKVLPSNWRPAQPPPTGGKHMASNLSNHGRRRAEFLRSTGDLPRLSSGPQPHPVRSRSGGQFQRAYSYDPSNSRAASSTSAAAPYLSFELPPLEPLPVFNKHTFSQASSFTEARTHQTSERSNVSISKNGADSDDELASANVPTASCFGGNDLSPDGQRILRLMSRKHAPSLGRVGFGLAAKRSITEMPCRGHGFLSSGSSSTSSLSSLVSSSSTSRRTSALSNLASDAITDSPIEDLDGLFGQKVCNLDSMDGFPLEVDGFGVDEYTHGQNPFLDGPLSNKRPQATSMHSCPSFQHTNAFQVPLRCDEAMDLTL